MTGVSVDERPPTVGVERSASPTYQFLSEFVASKFATIALAVVIAVVLVAIFAPWISPQNPYDLAELNILDSRLAPGSVGFDGTRYLLGTDGQGRDMLSAIFYGLRISLGIGVSSGLIALIFGTAAGISAGYFGGWFDTLIMRIVDLQLSFPAIFIALVLLAVLGPGIDKILIALIVVQWAYYARTARGAALVERRKEYVEAATCLALSRRRVIFRHILPNCLPPLIVVTTVEVANAIALEATLSFLGVGLPITEPSLGLLIANGYHYMLSGKYWISIYPGIALLLAIGSINVVGDHLRDILNPRWEL